MAALIEWTRRGKPEDARIGAIGALGRVARSAVPAERARILGLFDQLADEDSFRVRLNLIRALGDAGVPDGADILDKIHRLDIDGRIKRNARAAREALLATGSPPEAVADLKSAIEKLEEEQRKLKTTLEELRGLGKK
jgi:hypothetical protein